MLRRSTRVALTTAPSSAPSGWASPWPSTRRPARTATPRTLRSRSCGTTTQQQLRKRDGSGPRHAQRSQQRDRQGPGRADGGPGNRGADCPYCS